MDELIERIIANNHEGGRSNRYAWTRRDVVAIAKAAYEAARADAIEECALDKERLKNYDAHWCDEHRGDLSICCCAGEWHPCLMCENFALKARLAELGHPVSKEPVELPRSLSRKQEGV